MVSDSKEKSVYLYLYTAFVCLTFAVNETGTLYTVGTAQTERLVFEEDFDIGRGKYTVLHHLGGTQERLTHDEKYLLGKTCQIYCLFAGSIASSYDSYTFLAVEEAVASGTSRYSATGILLLVVQTEIFSRSTRGNYDRLCLDGMAAVYLHDERTSRKIDLGYGTVAYIGIEAKSLFLNIFYEVKPLSTFGIPWEILYFGSLSELPAGLAALVQNRTKVGSRSIDGSSVTRRSTAYYQTFYLFHIFLKIF